MPENPENEKQKVEEEKEEADLDENPPLDNIMPAPKPKDGAFGIEDVMDLIEKAKDKNKKDKDNNKDEKSTGAPQQGGPSSALPDSSDTLLNEFDRPSQSTEPGDQTVGPFNLTTNKIMKGYYTYQTSGGEHEMIPKNKGHIPPNGGEPFDYQPDHRYDIQTTTSFRQDQSITSEGTETTVSENSQTTVTDSQYNMTYNLGTGELRHHYMAEHEAGGGREDYITEESKKVPDPWKSQWIKQFEASPQYQEVMDQVAKQKEEAARTRPKTSPQESLPDSPASPAETMRSNLENMDYPSQPSSGVEGPASSAPAVGEGLAAGVADAATKVAPLFGG